MGRKQDDLFGAWGCSSCHDEVDGRTMRVKGADLIRRWFLEGVIRTQATLLDESKINV